MATRIDGLTDEQIAAMPAHAAEWIARGLDLTPADRPAAESASAAWLIGHVASFLV